MIRAGKYETVLFRCLNLFVVLQILSLMNITAFCEKSKLNTKINRSIKFPEQNEK